MPKAVIIQQSNTITNIEMKIILERMTESHQLEGIRELYISAFPAKERREFDDLIQLIAVEECRLYQIFTDSGSKAGLCFVWNFPSFIFLEHFAVEAGLRGLGIGEKTLRELKDRFSKVIVLETELPSDELSLRRINFYERNGFHKLGRRYFQPSYGKGKPEIELKLMSTNVDLSVTDLDEVIQSIREKVYLAQPAKKVL